MKGGLVSNIRFFCIVAFIFPQLFVNLQNTDALCLRRVSITCVRINLKF